MAFRTEIVVSVDLGNLFNPFYVLESRLFATSRLGGTLPDVTLLKDVGKLFRSIVFVQSMLSPTLLISQVFKVTLQLSGLPRI